MTVFAFWFDSKKEQHYPFLGTRVIRGRHFLMIFTTRVNSYIGTTIVVPDVLIKIQKKKLITVTFSKKAKEQVQE